MSLPATIMRRDSSTVGASSAFLGLASWIEGWALPGRAVESDSVTLTSGMAGVAPRSAARGGGSTAGAGSGGFCTGTGLGGAGTTLVMPSGSLLDLF